MPEYYRGKYSAAMNLPGYKKLFKGRGVARNNAAHVGVLAPKKKGIAKTRFAKKVQSAMNQIAEKKYRANSIPATAVDFLGSLQDFTATIPQGDTDITRDGDQLFMRSFEILYDIIASDATNVLRVLLFIWKPTSTPESDIVNK